MTKRIALGAVMMLAAMGGARSEGLDLIAVRQAGFSMQGGDFGFIRSVVAAKADVKQLEAPAKGIGKWAAVIPTLFPKGTETGGNTKALPEIWSDPSGFQKAAANLSDVAAKLAVAAKAGEADEVATLAKQMGDQCAACHKAYRAK